MAKHFFKSKVLHSGREFKAGDLCPEELHAHMSKAGVLAQVPEPKEAPEAPAKPEPKAKKE